MKKALLLLGVFALLGSGCSAKESLAQLKAKVANKASNEATELLSGEVHHTVIVPGYGAPVEGNRRYEEYIETVTRYVEDEANAVDSIVFTGSYSTLKDLSEAESMNAYFNSFADTNEILTRGIRVHKEECAIVSWQNISYTRDLLAVDGLVPSKVTIFGDIGRQDKLVSFGTFAFNEDITVPDSVSDILEDGIGYTEVDFRGFSFGNNLEDDEAERSAKFAAEIAGAYDATVGNEILAKRIGDWSAEFGYDVSANLVEKGCPQFSGF